MDDAFLEEIKTSLEAERDRLRDEVAELEASSAQNQSEASGENNYRDHMADQGSATFARELDMTLYETTVRMLSEVEAALERIADGTYGRCVRCGVEIPESRLRAVPSASLCIACKQQEESS